LQKSSKRYNNIPNFYKHPPKCHKQQRKGSTTTTTTTQQIPNYKPNPKQNSKNNRPENICTQNFNNNNQKKNNPFQPNTLINTQLADFSKSKNKSNQNN